jgi:5-methylcytosine-specific restriction endonuclease McrA
MITRKVRDEIRKRAKYACEYCGITENDIGGQLTIDHFYPQSKGGDDHPDNLIYCCHRCNSYKYDYFPDKEGDPKIWNPRIDVFDQHSNSIYWKGNNSCSSFCWMKLQMRPNNSYWLGP